MNCEEVKKIINSFVKEIDDLMEQVEEYPDISYMSDYEDIVDNFIGKCRKMGIVGDNNDK